LAASRELWRGGPVDDVTKGLKSISSNSQPWPGRQTLLFYRGAVRR
jgi:hypothetical protein